MKNCLKINPVRFGEINYQSAIVLSNNGDFPLLKSTIEQRKEDTCYETGEKVIHFLTCCNKDKRFVGILGYEIINENRIYLSPLEVVVPYRSTGIATMLIKIMKEMAKYVKYDLTLYCNDSLISFYEKFGFKTIRKIDDNEYEMIWKPR